MGASGARDSAGTVLGQGSRARVVLRHVPMVLEIVQAQFIAPVVEPTVVSIIVPLNGYTIVATSTVVTSYVLFVGRLLWLCGPLCCGDVYVAVSCGGGFTPGGAYDSVWDSVKPMTGNFFFYYFQYQEFVGCVCMLNYWFSSNDDICPELQLFPVQVEGQVSQ